MTFLARGHESDRPDDVPFNAIVPLALAFTVPGLERTLAQPAEDLAGLGRQSTELQ